MNNKKIKQEILNLQDLRFYFYSKYKKKAIDKKIKELKRELKNIC